MNQTRFSDPTARPISRRGLLLAGGGGAALVGISACSGPADGAGDGDGQEVDPDRPMESPMLTEQVEAGDLPPLEERLPAAGEEYVLETAEFGSYGHTYNGAVLGQGDQAWLNRIVGFEPMLRPDPGLAEEGLPGTLKSVDVSDDGTQYTLHLRQGMRWSDGEPCTADDVMFAVEQIYFNQTLYSIPPSILNVDGEPCEIEKVDDYTVQLTFPGPKGDFINHASRQSGEGGDFFFYPKHYFEEFIPDLNDDAPARVEEEGFSDWTELVEERREYWNHPDKPVLYAWMPLDPLNEGTVASYGRNPYYWKVDSEGAQLPFIDRLEFEVIQEEEVMLLKAVNGEIDFHARHFNQDANRPVLANARESGNYDFIEVEQTSMNRAIIALNLNHQDEELREIFQNKDFRIGLSHAIDRQDLIDTVYQRQGEPWQAAPRPESDFYDEEFAKQYTEYDVSAANSALDDAGLTETDSSGYRLKPSGQRLQITIDVTNLFPEWTSALDIVTRYWEEVGIDARVNTIERTLFYDRKLPAANQHDANVWGGDGGFRVEQLETRWWFPTNDESNYATRWANWFGTRGSGEHAEEPPEQTRRQMELYWETLVEPDVERQAEIMREILQIAKEQFYAIGLALPGPGFGIAKNDLRNVAESFPDTWLYMSPGHINPQGWFFDR